MNGGQLGLSSGAKVSKRRRKRALFWVPVRHGGALKCGAAFSSPQVINFSFNLNSGVCEPSPGNEER